MADLIANALIDVATSTGVDVVTKRNIDPRMRGLGRAYRVYSLVRPSLEISNAIRVVAYTDLMAIVCQELIVQFASQELTRRLISSEVVNYEVIAMAEKMVMSVDFAKDTPDSVHYLSASQYILEADLLSRDYLEHGRGLVALVGEAISRGVYSFAKADALIQNAEARKERRKYNFDRKDVWVERLNHRLGNIFWLPVPEMGIGSCLIKDGVTYSGTFRRNSAEGYGSLAWQNGTKYLGQICDGAPCGYGGYEFSNGGRYFGYRPRHAFKNIGAYITPNRDRVIVGVGSGNYPSSYGRQIGLRQGVESASGFWQGDQLETKIETMEQTNRVIARSMTSPYTIELKAEYEGRALMDQARQGLSDAMILSHLQPYL
jgi:hypothetical protein